MPHRTPNQVPRDAELLLGQALVMEHEAVVFPVQQLDLVAPPVGEGLQPAVKGVVAELLLAQPRQPLGSFYGSRRGPGTDRCSASIPTAGSDGS